MKRLVQFSIPAMIIALGCSLSTISYGSAKIVKETGIKTCKACHTTGKELNDAGKCFKEKQDLKACKISNPTPAPAK